MTHPVPDKASPPTAGAIAGRYEVVEESERPGGFAGYKVRHGLLDSLQLLTAVPDDVAGDPERLAGVREAVRAVSGLRHDHIVPVLDLVEDDGRYFIVEPFVDGAPLDRLIATSSIDPPDALYVARQLADALAYAHGAGVVHGTVSPANVVVEAGSPARARLSGFALAALAETGSPIPTRFLRYTAPERLGQEADACADVFGLGQVIFELFEGRPFLTGNRGQVEALLRDGTAPFVPRFSCVVPAGLSGLVARMIRRAPAERQQQMAHVRADLDACLRSIGQRATEVPDAPVVAPAPAVADRVERVVPAVRPAPARRDAAVEAVVPRREAAAPRPDAAPEPAQQDAAPAPVQRDAEPEVTPRAPERPAATVRPIRPLKRPRPVAAAPRAAVKLRLRWPAREHREATFPSRILVRASEPRTPVKGKLLVAGVLIALGWVAIPFAPKLPTQPATVAPAAAPEPVVAVQEARPVEAPVPVVEAPAVVETVKLEPPSPPRIESHEPGSDRITVTAGEKTTFRVWAAGGADGRLTYAWLLDGRPVGDGPEWQMVTPPALQAVTYLVEVKVAGDGGPATTRSWTVAVPPARGAAAVEAARMRKTTGGTRKRR